MWGPLRKLKRALVPPKRAIRSLEINLTAHCNLKCYGCGRGSPALAEEFLSVEELRADLRALAKVLRVHEFKLAGGEPLLHPRLLEIIDTVRASGIANKITLITNGVRLHEADDALWQKIDEIWVSAYPGVRRRLSQQDILELGRKHGVVIEYNFMQSFTRRLLNTRNADPALVDDIFSTCYQRGGCHSIYRGRYYQCASGAFIPKWLDRIGADGGDFSADGIAIHGGGLRARVDRYLAREDALNACNWCLGSIGSEFDNRQVNNRGVEEWTAETHDDLEPLIDRDKLVAMRARDTAEIYDDYGQRIDLSSVER